MIPLNTFQEYWEAKQEITMMIAKLNMMGLTDNEAAELKELDYRVWDFENQCEKNKRA